MASEYKTYMNHSPWAGRQLSDYLAIAILLLGLAWRAIYLDRSHPYVDEYFTILAATAVQHHGYPLLPSGLFYSHGLL
jgi:hypothetical protein